jgi:hypothetical protein
MRWHNLHIINERWHKCPAITLAQIARPNLVGDALASAWVIDHPSILFIPRFV